MPRKTSKSNQSNNTPVTPNDTFQINIKKWVNITQQIINLEKQLEKLREEQMNISRECVDLTANLTQEVKINSVVNSSNTSSNISEESKQKESWCVLRCTNE